MDSLNELYQARARAIAAMRSRLDEAEKRDGGVTAEDRAEIASREDEIRSLDARIGDAEARERLAGYESSLEGQRTQVEQPETREIDGEAEYRQVFDAMLRGLPLSIDETKLLRTGFVKEEARDMAKVEGGASVVGGYVAPDEFQKKMLARVEELSVIRAIVGRGENYLRTGNGNTLTFPREDARGAAAWLDEGAAFVESDDTFTDVSIEAWKAGRLVKATLELVEDSFFDLQSYLANSIGIAIAELEAAAFVNGDGVKKPLGFLQTATVGGTSAVGAAGVEYTFDEIVDLMYSVRPAYRERRTARFVVSDLVVRDLRKIKDGNDRPIWNDSVREGEPTTLLGKAVIVEPNMPAPALGSKSIAFGDLSQYMIRDVNGVRMARLGERYLADEGKIGYLGWHRTDGELLDPDAVKVLQAEAS